MDDIQGFIWYFYNVLTFSLLIKYNAFLADKNGVFKH